jgi:hypothetical protein
LLAVLKSGGFTGITALAAGHVLALYAMSASPGASSLPRTANARRVHRMRRTFCKGWRNDKWRDLLLAFWHWLADGAEFVDISLGEGSSMRLGLPPMTFTAPFGVNSLTDAAAPDEGDEDDDVMVDRDDDDQGDDDEGEV